MSDFQSIGARLKQAREEKELSLQDIEKQTRIRFKYLQAIEYGQFFIIDNPTQLRGFLRKYASTVGLEESEILGAYESALRGELKRPNRRRRKDQPGPPPAPAAGPIMVERSPIDTAKYANATPETYIAPKRSPVTLIFAGLIAVLIVGLIVGGIILTVSDLTEDNSGGASDGLIQAIEVGGSPLPPLTQNDTATPTAQPLQIGTPVLNPGDPITVRITALTRTWLRIELDGVITFEGVLPPGLGNEYQPSDYVTILTTNPQGLEVLVNNQPLMMGSGRQAVERTISVQNGILGLADSVVDVAAVPQQTEVSEQLSAFSSPTPSLTPTRAATALPTTTPTLMVTSPPGIVATSTDIPVFGFSSDTPTFTVTAVPPTSTPTFTASPFLPERATRTVTPDKGN